MPGPQHDVSLVKGDSLAEERAAPRVGAREFTEWLRGKVPSLRDRWVHEILARGLGRSPDGECIVSLFADRLIHLLPLMLGPHREQIQPLWDKGFAFFGAVAAKRGLAAGEVIEELHLLRELVIRDLYKDPPMGGSVPLSLREVLRLNRALDRAATHASVGHMDALFFEFFETEGAPLLSGNDIMAEAETQLGDIDKEVCLTLSAAGDGARPYQAN